MEANTELKDLEAELIKAVEEVTRLEAEIEAEKAWPQEGDLCYKLDPTGEVVEDSFSLGDAVANPLVIPFRTLKEASHELDRRQATIKVIRRVAELNKGWVPDWSNKVELKWYIGINKDTGILYTYNFKQQSHLPDVYALASGSDAVNLIKSMEPELNMILG